MANPFPQIPFQTQLDFLWSELQGPEKKTLEAFQSGGYTTPQDYAAAFEKLFERSGGSALDRRKQYALEVFKGMEDPLNPQGLSQNAAIAYNYLLNKGLNAPQAAGVVGNLMAESFGSLDPAAYNPKGGGQGALGIAQWRGPRLKSLLEFAGVNGEQPMVQSTFGSGVPTAGTIFPQQQPQGQGLQGLLQRFMQPNETTGLTGAENFAQALDALILPEARMGEQIRARGAQRLDKQRRNKTLEWLKSQEGGEIYAQAIEMGVPIGDVYSAYLKSQAGDYVVVGNTLVDRKTGKPIFTAPSQPQQEGVIRLADGTEIFLGKQSQTQAGSMDFGSRMTFANSILENTEQLGTNLGEQFFSKIPIFGGALTSPEFKQYDQARRTFVNAILRRESGAAIAESEFESANQQYFPQPFDTPEVIAQKRAARELATTMMLAASGPNATQYAKDQAAEFAKKLNPLFGTEEYKKQREQLKKNTSSTTTAGGNERVNF
jgi:hypothetical protein